MSGDKHELVQLIADGCSPAGGYMFRILVFFQRKDQPNLQWNKQKIMWRSICLTSTPEHQHQFCIGLLNNKANLTSSVAHWPLSSRNWPFSTMRNLSKLHIDHFGPATGRENPQSYITKQYNIQCSSSTKCNENKIKSNTLYMKWGLNYSKII